MNRLSMQSASRNRIGALLAVGCLSLLSGNALAATTTVPVGEMIINGGFATGDLTGWTPSSGSVNERSSGDAINTGTGTTGFSNFFTSNFAVLGDDTGVIGGSPDAGTFTLNQTFTLPAINGGHQVVSYDLDLSFIGAFNGPNTSTVHDSFTLLLNGDPVNSFLSNGSQSSVGGTYSLLGLQPGTYTLSFQLFEATSPTTNTALGIDTVSLSGSALVIPEPSLLSLLSVGLFGMSRFRNRQARSSLRDDV